MGVGSILLPTVEGFFVWIFLWALPAAFAGISISAIFSTRATVLKWLVEHDELPRFFVSAGLWISLHAGYVILSGCGIALLRGDRVFSDVIAPMILNYLAMLSGAVWSLPALYFENRPVASILLIVHVVLHATTAILVFIWGPWYAGATFTAGTLALIGILLVWANPVLYKFEEMKKYVLRRFNPKRKTWTNDDQVSEIEQRHRRADTGNTDWQAFLGGKGESRASLSFKSPKSQGFHMDASSV